LLAAARKMPRPRRKGMAAWGLSLPFWMKAAWFKKHGYRNADREFISALVWKPFVEDATAPHWVRQRKPVASVPGKVSVTASRTLVPAQNITFERAKRAAQRFGDQVVFRKSNHRPADFESGHCRWRFIDGKLATGDHRFLMQSSEADRKARAASLETDVADRMSRSRHDLLLVPHNRCPPLG